MSNTIYVYSKGVMGSVVWVMVRDGGGGDLVEVVIMWWGSRGVMGSVV